MNFYKNFKLTERFTLQFRGEMYNIFNHRNLYITTLNLDDLARTAPLSRPKRVASSVSPASLPTSGATSSSP